MACRRGFCRKKRRDILAVGSGIVTWSGEKSGYGLMVEISHNDGFVTRYAHNDKNIVELGSIVKKVRLWRRWAVPADQQDLMFILKFIKTGEP